MQLGKFFSHRMESYKELTCEFLASMKHHEFDELDRAELDRGWGKATGTINEGEVKLLTMGIKPIISRTRDGKKIRGDRAHAGNLMPLLEQLQAYKQEFMDKRRSTPPGWMDIKFCKTNLLIEHKVGWETPVYTLVGHEADLQEEEPELDRAEDRAEAQAEDECRRVLLGEPECYYFEEYEAPRMNPSVVAAHKRIGLLQKFNKWQGKAMDKMQKSMDKMVSKIKSLEKKVSGSSSKKKKAPKAPLSLGVGHSSPLKGGSPAQEPHRASSFEPREGEDNTQRRRKTPRPDAPARPPDSIESKQRKLNSIELTVELTWRSPCLRIRIRVRSNAVPGLLSDQLDPYNSFEQAQLHQGQGSHTHFNDEEEEEEEPQARSSEPQEATPVAWSAPDGRLPSPDHDLVSQFFGGH
ncbi:unnamed protein product [Microthlaspi erraticum]|uniref:Arabidopsis retrotransposon Orf1 C-terminal domain-containing protein n=1 Tax=Microthlaspi erraticum TaxID=1685480 RepID=A0A6D2JSG6_9BRAS|nr:unnamed protein product [Microthlaspi erraticum]